jgi:hypothetical protein
MCTAAEGGPNCVLPMRPLRHVALYTIPLEPLQVNLFGEQCLFLSASFRHRCIVSHPADSWQWADSSGTGSTPVRFNYLQF